MRKIILTLAIILTALWIYIIVLNYSGNMLVNIPYYGQHTIKTAWCLLGFGLFTCLIGGLSFLWYLKTKTDFNRNYQLKMDKLSVQSDNDKSQVQVLENKIKTLEAVVEKLTKEKNV